jgi:hypothetical protein
MGGFAHSFCRQSSLFATRCKSLFSLLPANERWLIGLVKAHLKSRSAAGAAGGPVKHLMRHSLLALSFAGELLARGVLTRTSVLSKNTLFISGCVPKTASLLRGGPHNCVALFDRLRQQQSNVPGRKKASAVFPMAQIGVHPVLGRTWAQKTGCAFLHFN